MTHIVSESDGPIGIITLNNPTKHNAFDDTLIADLTTALKGHDVDDAIRVVVISAAGESFSAGADLTWMKRAAANTDAANLRDAMALATLMKTLATLGKPTIARVQGAAYGGGVGLVACCDIAVASWAATFSLSEVKLGLAPAVISPYVIAAMGERNARRYFLSAEKFDAAEAYRIGLIHEVAPSIDTMDDKINDICTALLAGGPEAQRATKDLIAAVANRPVNDELIADTAARIARLRASAEGREGIAAFLEKRKPSWTRES